MMKLKTYRRIFLAESPLQIKYLVYSGCISESDLIIIRLNENILSIKQIKRILLDCDARVLLFNVNRSDRVNLIFHCTTLFFKFFFHSSELYICDYKSFWMRFLKYLPFIRKVVYADDGMSTVNHYYESVKNKIELNFSTVFKLEETKYIDVSNYLLPKIENEERREITILLGSAFDTNKFLDINVYIEILSVIYKNSETPIAFFPHRNESLEVINYIENLGCEVIYSDYSVEDFMNYNYLPKKLIGFCSTALYNTSISTDKVEVVSIDIRSYFSSEALSIFDVTFIYFDEKCDNIGVIKISEYMNVN